MFATKNKIGSLFKSKVMSKPGYWSEDEEKLL